MLGHGYLSQNAGRFATATAFSRRQSRLLQGPVPLQHPPQVSPGVVVRQRGDLFGRAGGDDVAAGFAAFGPEVDDPVGRLDHVEVVLDHEHRVAQVDQPAEHGQQLLDVVEVQAGGRLVEDVEVLPVSTRPSSVASLMRWASPPESVVDDWPSVR